MHPKNRSFSELSLSPAMLENLESLGYLNMTPIQEAALRPALAGRDLIAQAETGSGKTAAFALPLLTKLNARNFATQALVLCPTRELATQVAQELRRLARHHQNIKIVTLCGGQAIGPQIGSLEHGAHVVVGTPGRITDHLRKQTLSLDRVATLVLDEADRMLEMGFVDDLASIIGRIPDTRQTLLFSATYPDDIEQLSGRFQRSPQRILVESKMTLDNIDERFFICQKADRLQSLQTLLMQFRPLSAVIFCNTKQLVRDVESFLQQRGVSALALHGDMEQRDRDQVLIQFKQQSCTVLVASDVAARGLDIDDLSVVINFELPRDPDTYVHRIGRTGRAGKQGLALNLFADSERFKLDRLGEALGREISFESLTGTPPAREPLAAPQFVTLCIAGGKKQKVRAGDILGALTGEAGIPGSAVGKIAITDFQSYVAVARDQVDAAHGRLLNGKIKGRKFKLRRL